MDISIGSWVCYFLTVDISALFNGQAATGMGIEEDGFIPILNVSMGCTCYPLQWHGVRVYKCSKGTMSVDVATGQASHIESPWLEHGVTSPY